MAQFGGSFTITPRARETSDKRDVDVRLGTQKHIKEWGEFKSKTDFGDLTLLNFAKQINVLKEVDR